MPRLALALAIIAAAAPVSAQEAPARAEVAQILSVLADMGCEVAPNDIERTAQGFAIHDALCSDGRYEIALDREFGVINRQRK
ncbi:hypothetical protein ROJ8625_01712 [Roseivivax jejudonensis]|uniref:PepSY domain-containing protein n=1 Tax=Roseivivax jejudonensis TaxID=1529041 RepID=A0A1X6Z1U7_9RHOB|nr:hypothetical protein [Roseivivax jejudonensis]SLN37456.1 hypothetical protein ROJ8625_01712 [Roseivivax jejudonensis]